MAFAILWSLRSSGKPVGGSSVVYLVFAGIERFLVEIVRAKDDRFLGPFTLAQLTSVILVVIGGSPACTPGGRGRARRREPTWRPVGSCQRQKSRQRAKL